MKKIKSIFSFLGFLYRERIEAMKKSHRGWF